MPYTTVPGFDPILIERFPEYVRDLIQNEEDRMKAEFMVGLCLCLYMHVYRGRRGERIMIFDKVHVVAVC